MKMIESSGVGQSFEQPLAGTICIRRTWPQLGRALYELEHDDMYPHLTEQQKAESRNKIRETILEQCHTYEQQYEAFEFVKRGRAVGLVGNPHYQGKDGKEYELPYTGLEGCYAGSEEMPGRPGMTPAQIIEEEANLGLELLKKLKKYYIDHYSWAQFAKMQKASEDGTADVEDLRQLNSLWTGVVRRVNQRIYENEECQLSLHEQLEILFRADPKSAKDPRLQALYTSLLNEEQEKDAEDKAKKREREKIFRSRLEEHSRFRDETYAHLKDSIGRLRHIDYAIQDATFADANITERLYLPVPPDRNSSPPYLVDLTAEQLEGYLFLAHLGEKGGNPLTRSVLLTEHDW